MTTAFLPLRGDTANRSANSPTASFGIFEETGICDRFQGLGILGELRSFADLMATQAPDYLAQPKPVIPVAISSESTINSLLEHAGQTASVTTNVEPVIRTLLRRLRVEVAELAEFQRTDIDHLYEDETPVHIHSTGWAEQLATVDVAQEADDFDLPWA